jgi:hypothetical protein
MAPRKQPSAAFWATVVVVVALVVYPLSFGPACWWFSIAPMGPFPPDDEPRGHWSDYMPHAPQIYWPVGWMAAYAPRPLSRLICWYATVGNHDVWLPANWSGTFLVKP